MRKEKLITREVVSYVTETARDIIKERTRLPMTQEWQSGTNGPALEELWYTEWLPQRDFKFYAGPDYLASSFFCFVEYTHETLKSAIGWLSNFPDRFDRLIDVWAGPGLTTALLQVAFPRMEVFYHNAPGVQMDVARELFDRLGLRIAITDTYYPADVITAFECLEHFEKPTEELRDMVFVRTKAFIDCSSFQHRSTGHFLEFLDEADRPVGMKEYRRQVFSPWMRRAGFVPSMKALGIRGGWNGRPEFLVRPESFEDVMDVVEVRR